MGTFAETAIVNTVYRLLAGNKLPFSVSVCSKQMEVSRFCFPFAANKQKLPFSISSIFCIFLYVLLIVQTEVCRLSVC
jgi:hypothetical protein